MKDTAVDTCPGIAAARTRLTSWANGKNPYTTYRGKAPPGVPVLKNDLLLLLQHTAA